MNDLLTAFILCTAVFAVSVLLVIISVVGAFFKNVGTTNFGLISSIGTMLLPIGMYVFALIALHYETVWVAYVAFALNLYFLILQYFTFDFAVFTKNRIYRLTRYFVLKKYSYGDVTGYSMKKTSGKILNRSGQKTVYTYDVEISFNDGKCVSFSTKDGTERKIQYIKDLLKEHKCKK